MIEIIRESLPRASKTPALTLLNVSADELADGRPLRAQLDELSMKAEALGETENMFLTGWENDPGRFHYLLFKSSIVASVQLLFDKDDLVGVSTFSVHGDLMLAPRRIYSLPRYRAKWLFGHYVMPFMYREGVKRGLTYWVQVFNENRKNKLKFDLHHNLAHRHARWYVPPFLFQYIFEKVSDEAFLVLGVKQFASCYKFDQAAPALTPEGLLERLSRKT